MQFVHLSSDLLTHGFKRTNEPNATKFDQLIAKYESEFATNQQFKLAIANAKSPKSTFEWLVYHGFSGNFEAYNYFKNNTDELNKLYRAAAQNVANNL